MASPCRASGATCSVSTTPSTVAAPRTTAPPTVLGVVLTEQVAPLARHGLAISAGVTLYVAASNLVPEFQAKRGGLTAFSFFGGALAFFVVERLLQAWAL